MTSAKLPVLTFEIARDIGTFPEFAYPISSEDIERYQELTGDRHPLYASVIPPGFAAIFGREAYLRDHAMPGGGVLLGQSIRWLAPARHDPPLMVQAEVVSAVADERKRILAFRTTARQNSLPVCEIEITARWPT